MWRHLPKIVVLAALGTLVVTFYITQLREPAQPQGPGVVYIQQNLKSPPRPEPAIPACPPPAPCASK